MKISYAIPVCNEHEELKRLLDFLIKNEKLRLELGEKARKIAEKEFSKEIVLENFDKLINKFF